MIKAPQLRGPSPELSFTHGSDSEHEKQTNTDIDTTATTAISQLESS